MHVSSSSYDMLIRQQTMEYGVTVTQYKSE
jgi:hypothetical protein